MVELNEWVEPLSGLLGKVYTAEMLAEMQYEYQVAQLLCNSEHTIFGDDFFFISEMYVINGKYLSVWRDSHVKTWV